MIGCTTSSRPQTIPKVTQSQSLTPPEDVRNFRYCEIIPVFRKWVTLRVEVYNTIGLNDCPSDLWVKLEEKTLIEQYDTKAVVINGPRFWVLNEISGGCLLYTSDAADE